MHDEEITRPPASLEDAVRKLEAVTAHLRSPDGCPWDRKQTHATLVSALIEECYEVVDAIRSGNPAELREELGDLVLHVLLHAQIARESGGFTLEDVLTELHGKLVRRHPHVFADQEAADPDEVVKVWDRVKATEDKGRDSAVDGIPSGMPSLLRAEKAGKKAAKAGFDWPDAAAILEKVREEIAETEEAMEDGDPDAVGEEIGDLLFSIANLTRKCGMEAEYLLHAATDKFIARFRALEGKCRERGIDPCTAGAEVLGGIWNQVKAEGSGP